jgi:hypothetical protein
MIAVTAVLALATFGALLHGFGVLRLARYAVGTSREAAQHLRDSGMDDHAREKAARHAARRLAGSALAIAARLVLAALAAWILIGASAIAGMASVGGVLAFLGRWDLQAASAAAAALYAFGVPRWRSG